VSELARQGRQEIVATHLKRMLAQPDFPAFSEHIQEVMRRAADEETSLPQITNVILKDLSLTLKVLRTANSPYYNRSGRRILTVTHAVALLGLETIRDLAGGMMLFQHYRNVSPGMKELMLLSLLSASHARVTAERVGYPSREEAYLCGMFRNLGEVLMACYLPRKYGSILVEMKERGHSERESSLRVLRCTYEDLGVAAAQHWHVPDKVTACIRAEYPRLTKPVSTQADLLEALTSFSHGLTTAIHRKGPEGTRARLDYLLETHGPIVPVRLEELHEIAEVAIAETKSTFDLLGIPLNDLRLRKQMELAMETVALEEAPEEESAEGALPSGRDLLASLTGEVESLVRGSDEFDMTNAILMVIEALYRGVPFDRVLFALVAPDHSSVRGRLGLGDRIDLLLENFHFPLAGSSGPVALALLGKQDIWVTDGGHGEWALARLTRPSCFGIYPVVADRVVVGCFYVEHGRPVRPERRLQRAIGKLRDLTAVAISRTRNSARASSHVSMSLPEPPAQATS